jgi:hypothetical protein
MHNNYNRASRNIGSGKIYDMLLLYYIDCKLQDYIESGSNPFHRLPILQGGE